MDVRASVSHFFILPKDSQVGWIWLTNSFGSGNALPKNTAEKSQIC
jgi:hypothetical protein